LESRVGGAGETPPGPGPSGAPPAADDELPPEPPAEPNPIKYDLSDQTFEDIMAEVALVPGVSPLDESTIKEMVRTCRYLFDGFGKSGRLGMTQPERDEFVKYALEISGGAAPNEAVQKYALLKPIAVKAGMIKDERHADDEHGSKVEVMTGMIGLDTLLAKVVEKVHESYADINEEWIRDTAQSSVLPHLTSALRAVGDVYMPNAVDTVASRINELVAAGEHMMPVEHFRPVPDPAAMGGGAPPPGAPAGGAAAPAVPETRTPMKLEDAIEAARTSHIIRIDGTKFVDYLKSEKKKGFFAWAWGGTLGRIFGKKEEKKAGEPERKKRITYRDVSEVCREYVVDVMKRHNVPTSTSGSDEYVVLEDLMAAFTREINEISRYQASDTHKNEILQNGKKQIDYETTNLLRLPVGGVTVPGIPAAAIMPSLRVFLMELIVNPLTTISYTQSTSLGISDF